MADSEDTPLTPSPAVGNVNQDDESRMLLGLPQDQRGSVLKIVGGLPEEAWQTPVVPSGWYLQQVDWSRRPPVGAAGRGWVLHAPAGDAWPGCWRRR